MKIDKDFIIAAARNRPNKTAKGFTMHHIRREKLGRTTITNPMHPKYNPKVELVNTLIVRGTLDLLTKRGGGIMGIAKRVKKEHPIDKGYFKEVYIISDYGKRLLNNLKPLKL